MLRNMWGLDVSSSSEDAVHHLDRAVLAYLGLRKDTGDLLKASLDADPEFAMAHIVRGCFMLLFANRGLAARAQKSLDRAEEIARAATLSDRERSHLSALRHWCAGRTRAATREWTNILVDHPRDVLALKLSEYWNFYSGDSRAMRDTAAGVLHAWSPEIAGHGFVLGMYAFGLEESGDFRRAESVGRAAVDENPEDIWAAHAVAHVFEMNGRQQDGIAWTDELAPHWNDVNNFAFHVWWHRALYFYELGAFTDVLDLYDREIRAESTSDYLDITNAASLLIRLQIEGVDVGDRWEELAERSKERAEDHMLAFADAHYMMALAAPGRESTASATFLNDLTAETADSEEDQADIFRRVGLQVCRGIGAFQSGEFAAAADTLFPIRGDIVALGGSHAQRDVFDQILIESAIIGGRLPLARMLLSQRTQNNPGSPLSWRRFADVLAALGDRDGAKDAREKAETQGRIPSPD